MTKKKIFITKSAQLKTMETIAAIIVFSILFVIGIVIYSNMQASEVSKEQSAALELRAIDLQQIITSMPELRCEVDNCLDLYKLRAMEDWIKNQNRNFFYSDAFGIYGKSVLYADISVNIIYSNKENIELYSKTKGVSKQLFEVPVSVYDSIGNNYSFAILSITIYQ